MAGTDKTFYVWITLMMASTSERLISALVRKKYHVGPLSAKGDLSWECDGASLLALNLKLEGAHDEKNEYDASKVQSEIREILNKSNSSFFSIVTQQLGGSCAWGGGNVKFPDKNRFDKVGEEPGS